MLGFAHLIGLVDLGRGAARNHRVGDLGLVASDLRSGRKLEHHGFLFFFSREHIKLAPTLIKPLYKPKVNMRDSGKYVTHVYKHIYTLNLFVANLCQSPFHSRTQSSASSSSPPHFRTPESTARCDKS